MKSEQFRVSRPARWAALLVVVYASVAVAAPTLTTLATFNGTNGSFPQGRLVQDASGNLYGTTFSGGANGGGTVYRLASAGGPITTLASFNTTNGRNPYVGVMLDAAGNLYGSTYRGGSSDAGTIFRVPAGGGDLVSLVSFDGVAAKGPQCVPVADSAGNLYGTAEGGAGGAGVVFRVPAVGGPLTTVATFNGTNGRGPIGTLLTDAAGGFYGSASGNNGPDFGSVFTIAAGGGSVTKLSTFSGGNGTGPRGGLVADAAGNLYGTSSGGGPSGFGGVVFRIPAGGGPAVNIANFYGQNGTFPNGDLIIDAAGNLFGTTYLGGLGGGGTVFRVPVTGGPVTTLVSFDTVNGKSPKAGLFADAAGNLYGTTANGGASDAGTVFRISDAGFVTVPEPCAMGLLTLPALMLRRRR